MTLFISILLIAGFDFHWILYPVSVILWVIHLICYARRG